mgnify:CR=1 FL=1
MSSIVFNLFTQHHLSSSICQNLNLPAGTVTIRQFPDTELYLQIISAIKDKDVIIIDSLDNPNLKIMPLYFFIQTARELGARSIGLVAPYLAYMRQDMRFNPGEAVTSNYFAKLLSQNLDWLITVDPHLHRHHDLQEIYSIPTSVVHATESIVSWIKGNIENPLLIGPDAESQQWVQSIAQQLNCPMIVLNKTRISDTEVKLKLPDITAYRDLSPVLIDDIISTAQTMIKTVKLLSQANMNPTICIGIHAIFANNSYSELLAAGAAKVVTCNSIVHSSNSIDLTAALATSIKSYS